MSFPRRRFKTLLKIIIPILLVYIVYFSYLHFFVYPSDNFFSIRTAIKDHYNHHSIPSEVDYLVLGDSSGLYSINPTLLTPNSYSASALAESAYKSHQTLMSLSNTKIKKGILITQTFIGSHYDEDIWKIHVPIDILNFKDVALLHCGVNGEHCSDYDIFIMRLKFMTTKLYLTGYSLQAATGSLKSFFGAQLINDKKDFIDNINKNRGHYASPISLVLKTYQFLGPFYKDFQYNLPTPPSAELYYFKKIIEHAKTLGINVYYVITPMCTNFLNSDNSKYNRDLNKIVYQIKDENFKIIDGRPFNAQLNIPEYVDYNHLNEKGAIKFSKYLSELLTNASLEHSPL